MVNGTLPGACIRLAWPSASCRHNETMRDANNTPNQSVAADVSRLKLDPRPARNGQLRNRSDPAHAGCYEREWKSTRATGQGAIAGSVPAAQLGHLQATAQHIHNF